MAIHTERIRPTSATTETISEGLVGSPGSLNRNAFRELDYSDPSNPDYDDDNYGIFKVITENATFTNVDGGSVTNPRFIQMAKFSSHPGSTYIYSALLIVSLSI